MKNKISVLDQKHYLIIRENIHSFLTTCAGTYDTPGLLLDIAPQIHEGARAYFSKAKIETLDIEIASKSNYVADICKNNNHIIPAKKYDFVVCTEVLEHTLQPFAAIQEIFRILKPGGLLFLSVPFNFRIHGPLPDCWRFTEHGLRALLINFKIIKLDLLDTKSRWLMPIHYTVVARKNK